MDKNVITFGCRLNSFESEVIQGIITDESLKNTIVFNTCAVTKEAEKQAAQAIRRTRKENPNANIIVTGCAAQINPEKYAAMPQVNKVLGNVEKLSKEHYFDISDSQKVKVNDIMSVKETASHMVSSFSGRARAFVQVQNGCNHRCTFCIIPFGRGNSRSVPVGQIVSQIEELAKNNYQEVVITGVDITDYGKDLPAKPTLGNMLKRVLKLVPQMPRIRISSIDVAEIDDDLRQLFKYESRIMPHIHISMQAGDDMVLKRMKRRHLRQDILDFVNDIRQARPEIAFGADIIAGFPTETDEMFENTLQLVHEAKLQFLHIFPYSARGNTPAAKMPQIRMDVRKERAKKLRQAGEIELLEFLKKKINKTSQAIVENTGYVRAEDFSLIKVEHNYEPGDMVLVKITSIENLELVGEIYKGSA